MHGVFVKVAHFAAEENGRFHLLFVCLFVFQGLVSGHRAVIFYLAILYITISHEEPVLAVRVDLSKENLYSVPTNIVPTVTTLTLTENQITTLDNSSFANLTRLGSLNLNYNPLRFIKDGTFDNNPALWDFWCFYCKIESLPSSFGPITNSMTELYLNGGIIVPNILQSPCLDGFMSLTRLYISQNALKNVDNIFFSPTITILLIADNGLQIFPNISAERLPVLRTLGAGGNQFTNISDSTLLGMPKSLITLNLLEGALKSIGDLTVLSNLRYIYLRGNSLETIPDLLNGVPNLLYLYIRRNSRMSCDRRMCWWRLWERVRTLVTFDDVTCQQPSELSGYQLSEVNPKFMNCNEGNVHLELCALGRRAINVSLGLYY